MRAAFDRPLGLYRAAMMLAAALFVLVFVYFFLTSLVRVPVYDMLDWVLHWGDLQRSGDWIAYLWTPHNEHRIVWSRLLLLADLTLFAGTGTPFHIAGVILLGLLVSVILRQAWLTDLPERDSLLFLLLLATMPTFIVVMCAMPSMGVFLQTSAFATFSLALSTDNHGSLMRRVGALICAMGAAFGVSGGLLIWPVLVWYGWRRGHRWPWLLVVIIIGAAFTALYVAGLPRDTIPTEFDLPSIGRRIDFFIRFLGLPWSHSESLVWPGRFIGIAILVLACWAAAADLVRRNSTAAGQFGLALVLFAVLLAAAAAMVRFDAVPERQMPVRYSMFVTLAHAGLILAFAPRLSAWLQHRRLKIGVLLVAAILLVQQVGAGLASRAETDRYTREWQTFVAGGDWTAEMNRYVYPERERALVGLRFMQSHGLYLQPPKP